MSQAVLTGVLTQGVNTEALTLNLAPKTYGRYVDDTHARFRSKEKPGEFKKILNKQGKHIQFTIEDENDEKCLKFLGIIIIIKKKMGDMNLMFIANQLVQTYKLGHILVYPLTQPPAYSKAFLQELPKSVLKNT